MTKEYAVKGQVQPRMPQGPVGPGAEGVCKQVNKLLKPFGVKMIVNFGDSTMPFMLIWRGSK